eukprot:6208994-Pleurochrysis_carterae.AAC.1
MSSPQLVRPPAPSVHPSSGHMPFSSREERSLLRTVAASSHILPSHADSPFRPEMVVASAMGASTLGISVAVRSIYPAFRHDLAAGGFISGMLIYGIHRAGMHGQQISAASFIAAAALSVFYTLFSPLQTNASWLIAWVLLLCGALLGYGSCRLIFVLMRSDGGMPRTSLSRGSATSERPTPLTATTQRDERLHARRLSFSNENLAELYSLHTARFSASTHHALCALIGGLSLLLASWTSAGGVGGSCDGAILVDVSTAALTAAASAAALSVFRFTYVSLSDTHGPPSPITMGRCWLAAALLCTAVLIASSLHEECSAMYPRYPLASEEVPSPTDSATDATSARHAVSSAVLLLCALLMSALPCALRLTAVDLRYAMAVKAVAAAAFASPTVLNTHARHNAHALSAVADRPDASDIGVLDVLFVLTAFALGESLS